MDSAPPLDQRPSQYVISRFSAQLLVCLLPFASATTQVLAQAGSDDTTRAAARELAQEGIDAGRVVERAAVKLSGSQRRVC